MPSTSLEGNIFAGRYRVGRPIASGAMGSVYEAVHLETNRRRALKVMHRHLFRSDDMRERFRREARIAAEIESEYIVDVFDAGMDDETEMLFLVMERLRGEDLGKHLKRMGRMPPEEVLTYLRQVASALDRTHAASIVHRDLKPDNLFLTFREDGSPRIKILDFGIAKLCAEGTTMSDGTQSLGTPIYMAPEQFKSGSKLSGAADIYALGMVAFTLLVGTPYWRREMSAVGGLFAFMVLAVKGPEEPAVQRAARYGATLPPAFDAWFARVTDVHPAARFSRASEAIEALTVALGCRGNITTMAPIPPKAVEAMTMAAPGAIAPTAPSRLSSPTLSGPAGTSTGAVVAQVHPMPNHRRVVAMVAGLAIAALGVGAGLLPRTLKERGGSPVPASASLAPPAESIVKAAPAAPPAPTEQPSAPPQDASRDSPAHADAGSDASVPAKLAPKSATPTKKPTLDELLLEK